MQVVWSISIWWRHLFPESWTLCNKCQANSDWVHLVLSIAKTANTPKHIDAAVHFYCNFKYEWGIFVPEKSIVHQLTEMLHIGANGGLVGHCFLFCITKKNAFVPKHFWTHAQWCEWGPCRTQQLLVKLFCYLGESYNKTGFAI